jgi:carboxypeptidase C (cathepsin A)
LLSLLLLAAQPAAAQQEGPRRPGRGGLFRRPSADSAPANAQDADKSDDKDKDEAKSDDKKDKDKDKDAIKAEEPVVTEHEIKIGDETLAYTATAGTLPILNDEGEPDAHIFYIAYAKKDVEDKDSRPLMFSFNGGPGSASVWLHLGALGPRIIRMPDDASFARPPFRLSDNEATWLKFTDLVFIDPVGTGYSRAAKPELNRQFHGLRGDIQSVGDFIRLYLTREERWGSPLYLVGESYGTTRASGLSDYLVEHGVALNGIVLVSTVLNFQTLRFGQGNDLPYLVYLPSYAATAWYHKKLPDDLQRKDLPDFLKEVEDWTVNEYNQALERGDRMSDDERAEVVRRLARYTGLSERYVENSDLRIEIMHFCKELLRDRKKTVGRLDSRYIGVDESAVGETAENDPSMSAIRPPYTSAFQQYIRGELGFKTDRPYHILGEGVGQWDYGPAGNGYADTSAALRDALAKNPYMKIHVAQGYYDLATPFFATGYTLSHMDLSPEQRENFSTSEYRAGHMMYVHGPSLKELTDNVEEFVKSSSEAD